MQISTKQLLLIVAVIACWAGFFVQMSRPSVVWNDHLLEMKTPEYLHSGFDVKQPGKPTITVGRWGGQTLSYEDSRDLYDTNFRYGWELYRSDALFGTAHPTLSKLNSWHSELADSLTTDSWTNSHLRFAFYDGAMHCKKQVEKMRKTDGTENEIGIRTYPQKMLFFIVAIAATTFALRFWIGTREIDRTVDKGQPGISGTSGIDHSATG